ncbi:MAG: hypothetical protein IJH55_06785 [Romboutsia sp.]|nr:hypothetical protein [Romboutsia sp.]
MSLERLKDIRDFIKANNEDAARECINSNNSSEYYKGIFGSTLSSLFYIEYLIHKEEQEQQSILASVGDDI